MIMLRRASLIFYSLFITTYWMDVGSMSFSSFDHLENSPQGRDSHTVDLKALVPSESLCNPMTETMDTQCSSNSNCRCMPLSASEFVGICAIPSISCAFLTPCEQDHVTCSKPYTVCVRKHSCNNFDQPVCYPLNLIDSDICPPLSIAENRTTIFTSTSTTTATTTTTTTKATTVALNSCKCLEWNAVGTTVARAIPGAAQTNVYVPDYHNYRIQKFIPGDSTIQTLVQNGTYLTNYVNGLVLDHKKQNLYYCDVSKYRLQKFSLSTGNITTVMGGTGTGTALNQISSCQYFYVDSNNNIFVSDSNNHRVLKFTPGSAYGKVVAGDSSAGGDYYHLNYPTAMYVDETTSGIYIVDAKNNRLQRWIDGDFWTGGETLATNAIFNSATGLLLDQCGNLYVSNPSSHTILKYSLSDMQKPVIIAGTGQAGGTSTQLTNPQGITFDIDSNLYVSDYGNSRVQKFKAKRQTNCTAKNDKQTTSP
ncbi:unnamed protein product [Adineta ricciae]|uniref:Uncharacterized protein n=1 Tax=Adineta ricciae TaxID=249248 RepID=A0A815ZRE9_ADIRI|nr:unnamed protein product [Adineta ricciae]